MVTCCQWSSLYCHSRSSFDSSSLHNFWGIWKGFPLTFSECNYRHEEGGKSGVGGGVEPCPWVTNPLSQSDLRAPLLFSPPLVGRGRAGRLPKRGVRVGVNGWRREAGASMSGTGALDQHSWAGIGHTAGSGLHSSTKQDCEKRGK